MHQASMICPWNCMVWCAVCKVLRMLQSKRNTIHALFCPYPEFKIAIPKLMKMTNQIETEYIPESCSLNIEKFKNTLKVHKNAQKPYPWNSRDPIVMKLVYELSMTHQKIFNSFKSIKWNNHCCFISAEAQDRKSPIPQCRRPVLRLKTLTQMKRTTPSPLRSNHCLCRHCKSGNPTLKMQAPTEELWLSPLATQTFPTPVMHWTRPL